MKKTGFIGIGNMGKALVTGLINSGYHPKDILVPDADSAALDDFARLDNKGGICRSNSELVKKSETVILAVKPQVYPAVVSEIREELSPEHLVVTIAAGITIRTWTERGLVAGYGACAPITCRRLTSAVTP